MSNGITGGTNTHVKRSRTSTKSIHVWKGGGEAAQLADVHSKTEGSNSTECEPERGPQLKKFSSGKKTKTSSRCDVSATLYLKHRLKDSLVRTWTRSLPGATCKDMEAAVGSQIFRPSNLKTRHEGVLRACVALSPTSTNTPPRLKFLKGGGPHTTRVPARKGPSGGLRTTPGGVVPERISPRQKEISLPTKKLW